VFTKKFWVATLKQTIGVMAATATGLIPAAAALDEFDLKVTLIAIGLSGLTVILKALTASAVGDPESPNFTRKPDDA
jgi:hypothetical protein